MRVLPCLAPRGCRGAPALESKASARPLTAGQVIGTGITYTCRRCGRATTLSAGAFARLPLPTINDLLLLGYTYADLNDPAVAELVAAPDAPKRPSKPAPKPARKRSRPLK